MDSLQALGLLGDSINAEVCQGVMMNKPHLQAHLSCITT